MIFFSFLCLCSVFLALANASSRPRTSLKPRARGAATKGGKKRRNSVVTSSAVLSSEDSVSAVSSTTSKDEKKWGLGLVSLKLSIVFGGSITVGALLFKSLKKWKAAKGKAAKGSLNRFKLSDTKISGGIDSHQDFMSIMSSKEEALQGGTLSSLKGKYTILVFDCDASLGDAADKKARIEYFSLMQNLTSTASARDNNPMEVLYIPGKGNKSIMDTDDGSSTWKYISSNGKTGGPDVSAAIRDKFRVKPEELRIVVLGEDQEVVSENALDLLRINPMGMPWKAQLLIDFIRLGGFHEGNGGEISKKSNLSGKCSALYFSASWCQPCKTFTPKLVKAYEESIEKGLDTEVLFVSLDHEEEAFDEYRSKMPFPCVPFKDTRRALLQMGLAIKSIPALVVLDKDGQVITSAGVTKVTTTESLEDSCTPPSDVVDLSDGSLVETLQRHAVCVALSEGCAPEEKIKVRKIMHELSINITKPLKLPRSTREDLLFCVIETKGKLSEALRTLSGLSAVVDTNLKASEADVVVLDLSNEEFAALQGLEKSNDDLELKSKIENFAKKYIRFGLSMNALKVAEGEKLQQ